MNFDLFFQTGLQPYCHKLWNSLVLMNDSLRQEAETLNQSVEKKGKSKDRGNSSEQSTYRCNILVKQVSDKMFSWMRTLMWHSLTSQDTNISLVLSPLRVFFDAGWVDNLFYNVLWIFIIYPSMYCSKYRPYQAVEYKSADCIFRSPQCDFRNPYHACLTCKL